ncbi:MAG: hypothetical protein ACYSOO_05155 [Planctomycetota bacterium]|jgi:hypothetical protein
MTKDQINQLIAENKGICPCCGQKIQIWRKSIISTAVASLCQLVRMYDGKPIHHDKFTVLLKDRNFSQLALWGLVEPAAPRTATENSAGMWSPTQKGIDFVRGKVAVQQYVETYDNILLGFDGPEIGVIDALRKRFDYNDLLTVQKQRNLF